MRKYARVGEEETDDLVWEAGEREGKRRGRIEAFRIACEVVLVLTVIVLSLTLALQRPAWPRGANEPSNSFGFMDKMFMNDSRYANEDAFLRMDKLIETLGNWLTLSSKGRGYVSIPESERQGFDSPPYGIDPLIRHETKEAYMVSSFHQLHCLSTIMNSYGKLRMGHNETAIGFHIAHCFDYLRQGILCTRDVTLEGNNTSRYPGVQIPWGTTHRCIDWDSVREWADEKTVVPFPEGVGIL